MKLMAEMNRTELIEAIAATSYRVLGLTYILSAFSNIWHLQSDIAYVSEIHNSPTRYDLHLHQLLIMDCAYNGLCAFVMFVLSVPLSRLTCRGLKFALETKGTV